MSIVLENFTATSTVRLGTALQAPLTDALAGEIEKRLVDGDRHIVLDLTTVSAIDAAGVGELVRVWNMVNAVDGTMQLSGADRRVEQLLKAVGLKPLLFDSVLRLAAVRASVAGLDGDPVRRRTSF
jgi:anti-anti-sigma factor